MSSIGSNTLVSLWYFCIWNWILHLRSKVILIDINYLQKIESWLSRQPILFWFDNVLYISISGTWQFEFQRLCYVTYMKKLMKNLFNNGERINMSNSDNIFIMFVSWNDQNHHYNLTNKNKLETKKIGPRDMHYIENVVFLKPFTSLHALS